jgi:hypothetical protein
MTGANVWTLIAGVFYIAIIYTLVRPSSKGPVIVQNISTAFADLVRGATGETYNSSSGTWTAGQ